MRQKKSVTSGTVKEIARLSHLRFTVGEGTQLTDQFNETLQTIEKLQELEVKNKKPTSHVTGLTNVFRQDVVSKDRILSQKEALSNAPKQDRGYFVVKAIFNE